MSVVDIVATVIVLAFATVCINFVLVMICREMTARWAVVTIIAFAAFAWSVFHIELKASEKKEAESAACECVTKSD